MSHGLFSIVGMVTYRTSSESGALPDSKTSDPDKGEYKMVEHSVSNLDGAAFISTADGWLAI